MGSDFPLGPTSSPINGLRVQLTMLIGQEKPGTQPIVDPRLCVAMPSNENETKGKKKLQMINSVGSEWVEKASLVLTPCNDLSKCVGLTNL